MCWLCRWGNESDWCLSCFSAYSWNQQYSLTISFPILRFNLMWTLSEYNKSRIFRDCVSIVIIVSLFKPLFYLWTSWNHSLIAFSMNRVTRTESMRGISTMRFSLFAAPCVYAYAHVSVIDICHPVTFRPDRIDPHVVVPWSTKIAATDLRKKPWRR